jgi:Pentapeptide repeats (8 copies)
MADPKQLALLKRGAKAWNDGWNVLTPVPDLVGADMRGADLRGVSFFQTDLDNLGAHLDHINLIGAKLQGADFSRAYLRHAWLSGADLANAKFRGAFLDGADFSDTQLYGTNFEPAETMMFGNSRPVSVSGTTFDKAQLIGTKFRDVAFDHTSFTGSVMRGVWFIGVDFAGATGLEHVIHKGPSVIDVATIYSSGGRIPDVFLRGCGVRDSLIVFQRSLVGHAVQFFSCFISYSSRDQGFAERLHADLQSHGRPLLVCTSRHSRGQETP